MLTFRGFGQILKSRKDAEVRRQREGKRDRQIEGQTETDRGERDRQRGRDIDRGERDRQTGRETVKYEQRKTEGKRVRNL